ncbi:MAG: Gfo/Idh/MocA family protein [Acidimicrobiales bacterium]
MRALIIGLGAIGQRHARNLRTLLGDELELSALRSRRRSQIIGDSLNLVVGDLEADFDGGVFTDLDVALRQKPDMVFICTPTRLHVPMAMVAIRTGSAVFLEKPVSDDLEDARALLCAAKEHHALVAVGCQLRFHPALIRLHQLLAKEAVGQPIAVYVEQGEFLPSWHTYEDYRDSYAARRELGGGVVLTQIHEIDYLHWLFGLPRQAFVLGGTLGGLGIDVEDTASGLLHYAINDKSVPIHLHLDYLQNPPRRSCRVIGTKGTIEIDLIAPSLTHTDATGLVVDHDDFRGFKRSQMFIDELISFIDNVRNLTPPVVGLAHAVDTLEFALTLRRSLEQGTLEEIGRRQ